MQRAAIYMEVNFDTKVTFFILFNRSGNLEIGCAELSGVAVRGEPTRLDQKPSRRATVSRRQLTLRHCQKVGGIEW